MEPIEVRLTNDPTPAVIVGGVDLTPHVEAFAIRFEDGQMWAQFHTKADAQVQFPCHVTHVANSGTDVLGDLDRQTVDGWVSSGGMSESPGTRVLRHLHEWVASRS